MSESRSSSVGNGLNPIYDVVDNDSDNVTVIEVGTAVKAGEHITNHDANSDEEISNSPPKQKRIHAVNTSESSIANVPNPIPMYDVVDNDSENVTAIEVGSTVKAGEHIKEHDERSVEEISYSPPKQKRTHPVTTSESSIDNVTHPIPIYDVVDETHKNVTVIEVGTAVIAAKQTTEYEERPVDEIRSSPPKQKRTRAPIPVELEETPTQRRQNPENDGEHKSGSQRKRELGFDLSLEPAKSAWNHPMDMENRGDDNPSQKLKSDFFHVFAEPSDNYHSIACVWTLSHAFYETVRIYSYKILSLIFGLIIAVVAGFLFAVAAFLNIWIIRPGLLLTRSLLSQIIYIWPLFLLYVVRPSFYAVGAIFSTIRLHRTSGEQIKEVWENRIHNV